MIQERAITASDLLGEQLQTALNSRIIIEQAKGMLAERTGLRTSAAFQLMRDHARRHGARLSDVAEHIIDGTLAELSEPVRVPSATD